MATFSKGILGGFKGKVGTVVGTTFRGKDVIRSVPKPSGRLPTEKQLLQQAKFKLVVTFLQPLKPIQSLYFGQSSGTKSRNNLAASYLLDSAISVVLNVPKFIYNKILITKGDLTGFQNLTNNLAVGGHVNFLWQDNVAQGNAAASDVFSVVCYCENLNRFEIYEAAALREDFTAGITLPAAYVGKSVHVWGYFHDDAGKRACNSNYQGMLTIL